MKISVVIPTYNCYTLLELTLRSLEGQNLPYSEFEVIVADDGSTDGTADYLRKYSGAMNIRTVLNQINTGRASNRNRGIREAQNELIVLLDSDMEVGPDFLRKHLEGQAEGAQVSVGKIIFHPRLRKTGLMKYYEKRGAAKVPLGGDLPGRYFVSGNASLPTVVLKDVGGFDENIVHYGGEDLELGLRLAERLPLRWLPSALSYHRNFKGLDRFLELIRGYGEHSLPYLVKKHPGLERELRLDRIPPRSFYDLGVILACFNPFYKSIKMLAKLDIVPGFFYSYLIFYNYREGYHWSIRKTCSETRRNTK